MTGVEEILQRARRRVAAANNNDQSFRMRLGALVDVADSAPELIHAVNVLMAEHQRLTTQVAAYERRVDGLVAGPKRTDPPSDPVPDADVGLGICGMCGAILPRGETYRLIPSGKGDFTPICDVCRAWYRWPHTLGPEALMYKNRAEWDSIGRSLLPERRKTRRDAHVRTP